MSQLANALEGQEGEAPGRTSYVRVDGDTDSRDRRSAVLKFREDPTVKVALLSITAAGNCVVMPTVYVVQSPKGSPFYAKAWQWQGVMCAVETFTFLCRVCYYVLAVSSHRGLCSLKPLSSAGRH